MPKLFSRKQRPYRRRVREKTQEFYQLYKYTNTKYDLGISDEQMQRQADIYARLEADSHYQIIGDIFKGKNLWKSLVLILSAILTTVLTIAFPPSGAMTWKAYTIIGAAWVGSFAGLGSHAETLSFQAKSKFKNAITQSVSTATNFQKDAYASRNKAITTLFIYNPYAIFPEGSIYTEQNPGSNTYRAGLQAPNCMDGINGNLEQNALAKQLTNTSHATLGGNAHYDVLHLPFPTQGFEENTKNCKEAQIAAIQEHTRQIEQGITELTNNYFGCQDKQAVQDIYNDNITRRVNVRITRLNCYNFLLQNQYYRYASRLPIFLQHNLVGLADVSQIEAFKSSQYVDIIQKGFLGHGGARITGIKNFKNMSIGVFNGYYTLGKQSVKITKPPYFIFSFNENGDCLFHSYIWDDVNLRIYQGLDDGEPAQLPLKNIPKNAKVLLYAKAEQSPKSELVSLIFGIESTESPTHSVSSEKSPKTSQNEPKSSQNDTDSIESVYDFGENQSPTQASKDLDECGGLHRGEQGDKTRASIDEANPKLPPHSLNTEAIELHDSSPQYNTPTRIIDITDTALLEFWDCYEVSVAYLHATPETQLESIAKQYALNPTYLFYAYTGESPTDEQTRKNEIYQCYMRYAYLKENEAILQGL